MSSDRARWCLVCLHPIDDDDHNLLVGFVTNNGVQREILLHRRCDPRGLDRDTKFPDTLFEKRFQQSSESKASRR